MKTKQLLIKTLLVAVGMCAGSMSAWGAPLNAYTTIDLSDATTYTLKSFDFKSAANVVGYKALTQGDAYKQIESSTKLTSYYSKEFGMPVAFQQIRADINDAASYGYCLRYRNATDKGLFSSGRSRAVTIVGLKAGHVIKIAGTGNCVSSTVQGDVSTGTWETDDTDKENGNYIYTMTADGDFNFYMASSSGYIYTIDIYKGKSPVGTVTAPSGTSRKFTLSCEDASATIYYSETEKAVGEAGWTTYTSEVTTSATKIYAYSATSKVSSDIISFDTGAGSYVQLAAPKFTRTGETTATIAADQTSVLGSPTATLYYRVGTSGDFSAYSSGVAFTSGQQVFAYATADGYSNSNTAILNTALPSMTVTSTSQDFRNIVSGNTQLAQTATEYANCVVSSESGYYLYSADGTSASTNTNIVFNVSTTWTDETKENEKSSRKWTLTKDNGIFASGSGNGEIKILNLKKGQIVKVTGNGIYECGGVMTKLDNYCSGNTGYYLATAAGTGSLTIERTKAPTYHYVYSIDVYNTDNEIVGLMDFSTAYFTTWNENPIWINAGETGYYKFVNHNNAGATYQNWEFFAANESSENLTILRADNWVNTGGGTIGSFPTTSTIVSDLANATVELTVSLVDAGDNTYTLTSTAHITKVDGTEMSPDYVYTQTGLTASKLKLFLSAEGAWLEILEQAVKKNITNAGYATYYSNNALDFANAKPAGLTASIITGATGATLNTFDVENVPVETPVLLAGAEGTYTIPVIATSSTVVSANKLQGVHAATEQAANTIYVLMASPKVGFYSNNNAFTVGANTAYLLIDFASTSASAFYLFDDGSTTAIDAVKTQQAEDGVYYNLAGQRVAQPTKGLYIVNGKKVVVK